jgi:hypothetical protein
MGWSDYIRDISQRRSYARKLYEINAEQLRQVKDSPTTIRVTYASMKEPFDYVNGIYPDANVKQALVYHANPYILQQSGYAGVGGFYDIRSRLVFITDFIDVDFNEENVQAEFTLDEVLCHELIHYASNYRVRCSNRAVEEEIAYGKSIRYLRKKGRTDDFIIKKNMLPYLLSVVNREEVYREVLLSRYSEKILGEISEEALKILIKNESKAINHLIHKRAYEMGQRFIQLYGDNKEPEIIKSGHRELNVEDEL